MADEKMDKSYGVEPDPEPGAETAPEATPPDPTPKPIPESEIPPEPASIRALDVCPNCASPLGGIDVVVCLRCGYDMKALKVIKTDTKKTEAAPEEEDESDVLVEAGMGDLWLPAAMMVAGLGLVGAGCLWRSPALFGGEEAVSFGTGALGLIKMLLKTAAFTAAGVGGLAVLAHIVHKQFGDVKLAAVRMLGIMSAVGLLAFINVKNDGFEWTLEFIGQAAAVLGLSMLLFRLNLRDAATFLLATAFAVAGVVLLSHIVLWAVIPGG